MSQAAIKIRPKGKYELTNDQMNCLTWYVLSGCSKTDAFATFISPHLAEQKTLLNTAAKQFFSSVDAVSYLRAYRSELALKDDNEDEHNASEPSAKEIEAKKLKAIRSLVNWATEKSINIDNLDDDTAQLVLKVSDKVGLFNDMEKTVVKPQRYLPEQCSPCRYRLFVEQNISDGNIIDECQYCRAKTFATEHGFRCEDKKLLDIPKDVLREKGLEHYKIVEDDA